MRYILLFAAIHLTAVGFCQNPLRSKAHNVNSWAMYFGNHKISDQLGIHLEMQVRRNNVIQDPQQLLFRTGIDYYLKNNTGRFTLGYAFVETYPYGDFAVPNRFPEHRIWQQFLTSHSLGKVKLSHRYRLEQRFLGNATTGEMSGGRFENRFRYMVKGTVNLSDSPKPVFLAAYEEFFFNFGKEVAYNLFDQNRLYTALGFTLNSSLKLEAGYLYQYVVLRSLDTTSTPRVKVENNHTLQVGLFATFPF